MANAVYHPQRSFLIPFWTVNILYYSLLIAATLSFVSCQKGTYTITFAVVALLCDALRIQLQPKRRSFIQQVVCASLMVFLLANTVLLFIK